MHRRACVAQLSVSAVLLVLILLAPGCGSDDAESSPLQHCEAHRKGLSEPGCREPASPELIGPAVAQCVSRTESVVKECRPALVRAYECFALVADACNTAVVNEGCARQSREFAECASGGTCSNLTGGSLSLAAGTPERMDLFTSHELCACSADVWRAAEPGAVCLGFQACTPVCCSCPGSEHTYTAAGCDFASTSELGQGRCPTAERVCELTRARCALNSRPE
jgi:hypothetical protein